MRYKTLDQQRARELLDRIDPPFNDHPGIAGLEGKSGTGDLVDESVYETLRAELVQIKERRADERQAFDAEACVVVHKAIPSEPELLSDDGFWRWLALGPLQEIVVWRFPPGKGRQGEEGDPIPKLNRPNFGVGASARQRSECYPYKLWLRGELGRVAGEEDPYRFARRGDVDFWTSHIHRQTYTTNRPLCAALVRFQYPDERGGRPRVISGVENLATGRRGIRTLAKRIKRLQATCELTVLDPAELDALVFEQATDLTPAR